MACCTGNRLPILTSCLLAWLTGADVAQAQHHPSHPRQLGFYDFQVMNRTAVADPFAQQARNGLILDQTLWNHHYVEIKDGGKGGDDLRTSAVYLLDRLARRNNGELLELHVQTARDLAYNRANYEKYGKFRSDLDKKRVTAIVEYMAANHPNVTFVVRVIDPAPVGMAGPKALKGFKEMTEASRGVIPPELQNALSAILGGSGNTAVPAPPPAAPPAPPAPGGLGAEAAQGGGIRRRQPRRHDPFTAGVNGTPTSWKLAWRFRATTAQNRQASFGDPLFATHFLRGTACAGQLRQEIVLGLRVLRDPLECLRDFDRQMSDGCGPVNSDSVPIVFFKLSSVSRSFKFTANLISSFIVLYKTCDSGVTLSAANGSALCFCFPNSNAPSNRASRSASVTPRRAFSIRLSVG